MNLIIDIGNTRAKLAVYEVDNLIVKQTVLKKDLFKTTEKIIKKYTKIKKGIISSVGIFSQSEEEELKKIIKLVDVSPNMVLPFKNLYNTPKTLGSDRIALIAAAAKQFHSKNTLIIDAGTCITFDFLNSQNEYLGGAISLGLSSRYKALNELTAKLPLLKAEDYNCLIGNSTINSIHSGVINGLVNEIDGNILEYNKNFEDLTVILTGGDTNFLSKRLKSSIFANSNFLLEGLNHLLQINSN
jgi:type III pantothenate kinase|tara:strand:+ start:132 stop:860 length:729 start_codon:yes stop_codon:yes gene_type:complete